MMIESKRTFGRQLRAGLTGSRDYRKQSLFIAGLCLTFGYHDYDRCTAK
uniref:Uncharacterized protein n=1 Tax=Anopheles minimus TaxID=112268 RepID=A0A182WQ04_9DIPT